MKVSLVIPGRNEEAVIGACLNSVVPLMDSRELTEIIFVDDASVDGTAEVAGRYPVDYVRGEGRGPGAARNLGWRRATGDVIWFLDADCLAGPQSLPLLLRHLNQPGVAGAGGSFDIASRRSLLARTIHAEIMVRHRGMKDEADHLASGHVVFRREVLERLDGFDERFITAEDAELSYRMHQEGYQLVFDRDSRVKHHYPTHLRPYFKAQFKHAYWRTYLYYCYRGMAKGDSYSGIIDFIQPFLALTIIAGLPFRLTALWLAGLLLLLQLAMALKIRTQSPELAPAFIPLGFFRAFIHGFGMALSTLSLGGRWFGTVLFSKLKNRIRPESHRDDGADRNTP